MNNFKVMALDKHQIDEFINVAESIRGHDPQWIAPMKASTIADLTGQGAFSDSVTLQSFVCRQDQQAVGRITAIINQEVVDERGQPIGQLGYFECVNNNDAARYLFKAATAWLAEHGAQYLWGPINGAAHREHRLMTSGFDRPAFFLEPRNPEYYPKLFSACGFDIIYNWYSTEWDLYGPKQAQYQRIAKQKPSAKSPYLVEWLNPAQPETTLLRLHKMLDRMWVGHLGFVAFSFAEFTASFGGLLTLMDDENILVVKDKSGQDLAFAMLYPDHADSIRRFNGEVKAWQQWHPETRPERMVAYAVAMDPNARKSRLIHEITRQVFKIFYDHGYQSVIMSLSTEAVNWPKKIGELTRTYALYGCKTEVFL